MLYCTSGVWCCRIFPPLVHAFLYYTLNIPTDRQTARHETDVHSLPEPYKGSVSRPVPPIRSMNFSTLLYSILYAFCTFLRGEITEVSQVMVEILRILACSFNQPSPSSNYVCSSNTMTLGSHRRTRIPVSASGHSCLLCPMLLLPMMLRHSNLQTVNNESGCSDALHSPSPSLVRSSYLFLSAEAEE